MPDKAPNTNYSVKPTLKASAATDMGKKFDKNLSATNARNDVDLTESDEIMNEIDMRLDEKQGTLKKKIWDLSKMEALVHSDPKLETVYQEMETEAEENQRYGYHWNEAVLNIMFNDYVLNSPKYLQKYKMAIPKEKKRRDKSGIKQQQRAGEVEMKKKGVDTTDLTVNKSPTNVPENYDHNNSLEGVVEQQRELMENWAGDVSDEPNRQPVDQSNQRDYLDHRLKKKYDTMNEHHLESREQKEAFIYKHKPSLVMGQIKSLSDSGIDKLYNDIEEELGMVDEPQPKQEPKFGAVDAVGEIGADAPVDESINESGDMLDAIRIKDKEEDIDETTSAGGSAGPAGGPSRSAGYQYSGPFGKPKHKKGINTSFWEGGEMVESNYLTKPLLFEQIYNYLNEDAIGPEDDTVTPLSEGDEIEDIKNMLNGYEIESLDNEGIVYVDNGIAYSSYDQQPIELDDQGWKDLWSEYIESEGLDETKINEKAKSKNQQQFMGMVHAAQKGELDNPSASVEKVAKEMKPDDVEDFASTKHKGLPEKVKTNEDVNDELETEYVEYYKDYPSESDFQRGENKYKYVWAKYPSGKIDIGVYNYNQDLVHGYKHFRKNILGIDEGTAGKAIGGAVGAIAGMRTGVGAGTGASIGSAAGDTIQNKVFGEGTLPLSYAQQYKESRNSGMSPDDAADVVIDGMVKGDRSNLDDATISNYKELIIGAWEQLVNEGIINSEGPSIADTMKDVPASGGGMGGSTMDGGMFEGKEIDEDIRSRVRCKKDEEPVKGTPINRPGGCKKKETLGSTEDRQKNPHNIKSRQKRIKRQEMEQKKKMQSTDLDKSKKELKEQKAMFESVLSEDKKPASLVNVDRLGKENEKNFKKDKSDSTLSDVIDTEDELSAMAQIEEVGENPYDLAEKIEAQKIKDNKMQSFDNEGDSTNDDNKHIPKRNLTSDEDEQVQLMRNGMHSIVYDNKPSERFEERMERDMGEEIYDLRQKQMEFKGKAPMFNKDAQPTEDTEVDTDQYNKYKKGYITQFGESVVTGKYKDEFSKTKYINFKINEAKIIETIDESFTLINMDGLGNRYTTKVELIEGVDKWIEENKYYIKEGKLYVVSEKKSLNESKEVKEKDVVNEGLEKMKKLWGYKPSEYAETKHTRNLLK